eukprot:11182839-Lingulodinium_polyedra.AAC.1
MAEAEPDLRGAVHDDNCHVRVFARTHRREHNDMSKRLAAPDFFYIIDRPHSRGHVDPVCQAECFPDVEIMPFSFATSQHRYANRSTQRCRR